MCVGVWTLVYMLDSLTSCLFVRYKSWSTKKLMSMLHTTNEKLKKFSHVNKKARDQVRVRDTVVRVCCHVLP